MTCNFDSFRLSYRGVHVSYHYLFRLPQARGLSGMKTIGLICTCNANPHSLSLKLGTRCWRKVASTAQRVVLLMRTFSGGMTAAGRLQLVSGRSVVGWRS